MRDAMRCRSTSVGHTYRCYVIMDFMAQVQTLMMSSQYEVCVKKANLKATAVIGRLKLPRE